MSGFTGKRDVNDEDWDTRSEVSGTSGVSALTNSLSSLGGLPGSDDGRSVSDGTDYSETGSTVGDDEEAEFEMPEYACNYCGISDVKCLLQCVATKKWFCNGRGKSNQSHIVSHLVKSKNKEVRLHEDSKMGDVTLECYQCGQRNVFLLGSIPSINDSVVVLLCREPCLNQGAMKGSEWDVSQWSPLIHDKVFVDFLVDEPTEKQQLRSRQVDLNMITKIEDIWREDPEATIDDIDKFKNGDGMDVDNMAPVQLRYDDGYEYQNIMAPLIYMESEENRRIKQDKVVSQIIVKWEKSLGNKRQAVIDYEKFALEDQDLAVVVGDELVLKLDEASAIVNGIKKGWEGKGTVVRIDDDEVYLELADFKNVPTRITEYYTAEFVWKSTSYDRMQHALKTFAVDDTSVSGYLYHMLNGHEVTRQSININPPDNLSVPGLPALNRSQEEAVQAVLISPLSLIQGPPGTGKTLTSASIVYHLSMSNRGKGTGRGQVLVCAPSNVAVDQLTEKISKTGLKVTRLAAKSREAEGSSSVQVEELTLHNMVKFYQGKMGTELRKYQLLKDETGELLAKDAKMYRSLIKKVEKEVLDSADVICCTCVGAGDPRLRDIRFRQLLIDESTQSVEAECLIPIVMGVKQLVLVGDQCQLGPVVMDKKAAHLGLSRTLFERLMVLGTRPYMLQEQYRMHPAISHWPSNTFYDGRLQNGVAAIDRDVSKEFPELHWLDNEHPLFFMMVDGQEEMAGGGTSYVNRSEAVVVEKVSTLLMKSGVMPEEIGVITPYQGQKSHVINHMTRFGSMQADLYAAIEVASVDSFQGREKDFIVLSCVRSNESQGIGFLRDPRRLNVAITRARYGVIIIGNGRLLSKNDLWCDLLHHLSERDAFMGPSFPNLAPSRFVLPPNRMNREGYGQSGGYGGRDGRDGGENGDRQTSYSTGMSTFGNKDINLEYSRNWGDAAAESRLGVGASAQPVHPTSGVIEPLYDSPRGGAGAGKKAGGKFDSRHDKMYESDAISVSTLNTQSRSIHSSIPEADRSQA